MINFGKLITAAITPFDKNGVITREELEKVLCGSNTNNSESSKNK